MVSDARHVLPYEKTVEVAIVIPPCRFKLDMLADHIESHLLGLDDVKQKSLVRRCSIKSVWPPSLIERSELEQRLVVEGHPLVCVRSLVLHYRNLAHCSISVHAVNGLSITFDPDLDTIKIR